jgi:hypothetical protein
MASGSYTFNAILDRLGLSLDSCYFFSFQSSLLFFAPEFFGHRLNLFVYFYWLFTYIRLTVYILNLLIYIRSQYLSLHLVFYLLHDSYLFCIFWTFPVTISYFHFHSPLHKSDSFTII